MYLPEVCCICFSPAILPSTNGVILGSVGPGVSRFPYSPQGLWLAQVRLAACTRPELCIYGDWSMHSAQGPAGVDDLRMQYPRADLNVVPSSRLALERSGLYFRPGVNDLYYHVQRLYLLDD
jgi:hypothetical protein